jgi:hypothetical protein
LRTTSTTDADGKLQLVQSEIADTTKISPDTQETKTMTYVTDGTGALALSRQTQELQTHGANQSVDVKTTTLVPDGNGKWELVETKDQTIKATGQKRTTEEKVSRPDYEGKLSEVSHTISEETETGGGQKSSAVETYSPVLPGVPDDEKLHLNQRVTTVTKKDAGGETTQQQTVQPDPTYPDRGPQVTAKSSYVVRYSSSGSEQTNTVQTRDGAGTFRVFMVQTSKSDQPPPAQTPLSPSAKTQ